MKKDIPGNLSRQNTWDVTRAVPIYIQVLPKETIVSLFYLRQSVILPSRIHGVFLLIKPPRLTPPSGGCFFSN